MSEREIVVDWDRFRIYVKGWSFEHGNWPMVSPGHQRDCLSLLREVEKMEHEREIETREYEGARSLVKFHGDRAASYLQDRDSLKTRLEVLQDRITARSSERDRAEHALRELHTTEEILRYGLGTALADRDRLREGILALGKAWACGDPEGPSTKEEMTANECAADLWALLEIPQKEDQGDG